MVLGALEPDDGLGLAVALLSLVRVVADVVLVAVGLAALTGGLVRDATGALDRETFIFIYFVQLQFLSIIRYIFNSPLYQV